MSGVVIWFTGVPGSGKSTQADLLVGRLRAAGHPVELLDDGAARIHLSAGLGFSRADRDLSVRRLGYAARLLARNGVTVVVAAVSPYEGVQAEVRAAIESDGCTFIEIAAPEATIQSDTQTVDDGHAQLVELLHGRQLRGGVRRGFTVWFTGLSGSGKTTQAALLIAHLRREGRQVELLDGDELRKALSAYSGVSREDRDATVRRIGYLARLLSRSGAAVVVSTISRYRAVRDEVRRSIEADGCGFAEIFMSCPLDVRLKRDPKGLYERARLGEANHFTGVDDPYEEPPTPDLLIESGATPVDEAHCQVVICLGTLGLL